jgi:hypothetical protein
MINSENRQLHIDFCHEDVASGLFLVLFFRTEYRLFYMEKGKRTGGFGYGSNRPQHFIQFKKNQKSTEFKP